MEHRAADRGETNWTRAYTRVVTGVETACRHLARCYTRRPGGALVRDGGREIGEALRTARTRLTRKQFLFLYPLFLGMANLLAFLAVYSSLEGTLSFTAFAKADYSRWQYLQEHLPQLRGSWEALTAAGAAVVVICLLTAAVRAPYYRAIAGNRYPLAPDSLGEFVRLASFYALTYLIFYLPLFSVTAESTQGQILGSALLVVAVLLVFADYALVFERLGPIQAMRRSVQLLRHGWHIAIIIYLVVYLLWAAMFAAFGYVYDNATSVFPLFLLSQLIIEALALVVVDVVLIFTFDYLRRV